LLQSICIIGAKLSFLCEEKKFPIV